MEEVSEIPQEKMSKQFTDFPRAPIHVMGRRILRRSMIRFPISMIPLAAISLEVILITPSLVATRNMKQDILLTASI